MKTVPFAPLDPALYRETVRRALAEDLGWGDLTTDSVIGEKQRARGVLIAKSRLVVAGLDIAAEAFMQLDPGAKVARTLQDSDTAEPGGVIADVSGYAGPLLTAERTALNFLQQLSGMATLTRRFVDAAAGRVTVLDTRKTPPTLRALAKYAVRCGGGTNHRSGLDDGLMIKDNHIRLSNGIREAVLALREAGHDMPIEVEAQSLAQVDEALAAGVDLLMIDNMTLDDMREAIRRARGRAKVEISGGVTLERIDELAGLGAEYVSVGALTHSAPAADISFEIERA
ncbi:MAG TPA: carboxylating nicotinate-nucleotide diphosphorylase [Vicinamibacterales bacterium]|nr:carboxylating nicotinate-nucleotide diphosphorylase [Vicinamibacterales bacterium]